MRTHIGWGLAAFLFLASLGGDSPVRGEAKAEEDVGINAPESFPVPHGGMGHLSVTIDRKKWRGPVQVELRGLPAGVTVKEPVKVLLKEAEDPQEKEKDQSASFTLVASDQLDAGKEYPIRVAVIGTAAEKEKTANLEVRDYSIRGYGLMAMVVSVTAVLLLASFCIFRVLSLPPLEEETLKGPLEIDTKDTQDAD
jgi:hypothetical protein